MSEFIQGFQTTEGEKKYDYNALGNLPDLSISKEDITGALGFVPPSKAEVEASVKVASNAAATADGKAVAAQTTANQAVGAAQQAQSTADGAVLAAQNAQNRADGAHERIDDSQTQVVQGSVITIDDCDNAPLQNLRIFGKTTQNGTPAPETPVSLESVGADGSVDVTVCGKNLYDASTIISSAPASNFIEINNDKYRIYSTKELAWVSSKSKVMTLLAGVTYTLSGTVDGIVSGVPRISLRNTSNKLLANATPTAPGRYYCKYTPTEDVDAYVSLFATDSTAAIGDVTYSNVQLEVGSTMTDYEPYKDGGSVTFSTPNGLPGIPVASGGNYTDENGQQWLCDEVDFEKGTYVQRVQKRTVENARTKTWGKLSNGVPYIELHNPVDKYNGNTAGGLSNVYPWASTTTNGVFRTYKDTVLICDERFTDLETGIALLQEMGFEALIGLRESTETALSAEELTAYATLHTNYPNTTVFNDGGAGMEVKYATPTTVLPLTGGRMNGSIDMVNHQLTGLPTPKNNTDAVSLEYLQETKLELAQGINDVSDIAYSARETADDAHKRIDDSQVQVIKGEIVSVGNSADAPLQGLRIFGKTEQKTTTGKNLVDVFNESMSVIKTGATAASYPNIVNVDGSITIDISGSISYGQGFVKRLLAGQTVTISYTVDSIGNGSAFRFRVFDMNNNATPKIERDVKNPGKYSYTYTPNVDSEYLFCWFVVSGTHPCGAKIHDLQLEYSSTATEYEPYTGGMPSPNPDYPQPLESVGDDESVDVRIANSNLLPFPYFNKDGTVTNGLTFNIQPDGSVVVNGTATAEAFFSFTSTSSKTLYLPKGRYTFSGVPSGFYGGSFRPQLWVRNADNTVKFAVYAEGKTVEITEPDYFSVSIDIVAGNTLTNFVIKPMISVGGTALPFEPPIERQTLTVNTPNGLPGIPVSSGGNYTDENGQQWVCDEVDFEKGQYIQRIYSYTFTGQETINSFDSGKTLGRDIKKLGLPSCVVPNKDSGSNVSPMLCTHEAVTIQNALKNDSGGIAVAVWGNTQYVYFSGTYYGDANGLKTAMEEAYASGNPYIWMYAMETPIIRELTETEKVDYTALHTNFPNTTVLNDDGAEMEVKYATPTTALPLTGGRYKVATPYAPTDAVPKSYADRIDKKVDTLRQVVSSFHSNIVQEASGEVIQVYGSAEAPLAGLKVFGKTEQKTTTGKNLVENRQLLNETYASGTVQYRHLGNGRFTLNGTASVASVVPFIPTTPVYNETNISSGEALYTVKAGQTFYLNGVQLVCRKVSDGSAQFIQTGLGEASASSQAAYTTTEDLEIIQIRKLLPSGVTYTENVVWEPTLSFEKMDVYEPYTGGKPSPSPEYPQELESVGESVNMTVTDKNLLSLPYHNSNGFTQNGIQYTIKPNGAVVCNGTATAESLFTVKYLMTLPAGTYFLCGCPLASGGQLYLRTEDKSVIVRAKKDGAEFTLTKDDTFTVWVDIFTGTKVENVVFFPVICKKHQSTVVFTPNGLKGIPVTSGGNYIDENGQQWLCDEVDFEKGVYIKRIENLTAGNAFKITVSAASNGMQYAEIYRQPGTYGTGNTESICNAYIWIPSTSAGRHGTFKNYVDTIVVFDERFTDVATATDLLTQMNFNSIYCLRTPIETALSEEELTAYAALHTNYPDTTVFNDGGAGMKLKYVADTKLYVDKKFEELAEILVNKL